MGDVSRSVRKLIQSVTSGVTIIVISTSMAVSQHLVSILSSRQYVWSLQTGAATYLGRYRGYQPKISKTQRVYVIPKNVARL